MLYWKTACKLTPIETISLLCLYTDVLFVSSVAVVEPFHFCHKCQLADEKAIYYGCLWYIVVIFISVRSWQDREAVTGPLVITKPKARNIITLVFCHPFFFSFFFFSGLFSWQRETDDTSEVLSLVPSSLFTETAQGVLWKQQKQNGISHHAQRSLSLPSQRGLC